MDLHLHTSYRAHGLKT